MPQWATFVGLTGVVLVLLLVLSHLTQSTFSDGDSGPQADESPPRDGAEEPNPAGESADATAAASDADRADIAVDLPPRDAEPNRDRRPERGRHPDSASRGTNAIGDDRSVTGADDRLRDASRPPNAATPPRPNSRSTDDGIDPNALSTGMLLANVAFSQGLFALVLLGAAIYAAIPASALGIEFSVAYLETGLLLGSVAGLGFYVANELAAAVATRLGFDHEETLRELLAPDSVRGWLVLLLGVLPIIAVFEEFLFRAALIGVPAAAFGLSPWLLAVGSSIAFALGHGMQGSVGVVVTGLLGFVLAALFIVTGSLLVVVVAHYLVNALEFVVHEGFDLEWADTLGG